MHTLSSLINEKRKSVFSSRRPYFFVLFATIVLFVVFVNTSTLSTWKKLILSNLGSVQNLNESLTNIFTPNSGQEVLPVQVQQMLFLLQTNQVASYQLSNQLDQEGKIKQRIIEAAWPIRKDSTSPYLISLLEEIKSYPSCILIDQREEVALAYCH